jgi:hypothetical protein
VLPLINNLVSLLLIKVKLTAILNQKANKNLDFFFDKIIMPLKKYQLWFTAFITI